MLVPFLSISQSVKNTGTTFMYIVLVPFRGMLGIHSNIYDGAFLQK